MKFDLNKYKGGFVPDRKDSRDWQFEQVFGAVSVPDNWSWRDKMPKVRPFQGAIPSCVSNAFAFLEAFKQLKDLGKDDYHLSWRFIWANTPHTKNGSTFRDNAKTLQNKGTSLYSLCEDKPEMGYDWVEDPANISEKARQEAVDNRINNYQYVSWQSIKQAIYQEPIIIAVGGKNDIWNTNAVKANNYIIDESGVNDSNREWGHAIVVVGYRKDDTANGGIQLEFANWWGDEWGDKGYAWLKNPDLMSAISIQDLPNFNNLMRLIKSATKSTVYLTNEKAKVKQEIYSVDDYVALTGKSPADWSYVETVDDSILDQYQTVGKILAFNR